MNIKVDLTEQLNTDALPERRTRMEGSPSQTQPVQAEDKVELSIEAQNLASLQEKAMNAPDIRTDKVNSIMKQIQEGSYTIDSRLIAERLIKDHLAE